MRRAEMARRRKNLSEKRNEEEKVCSEQNYEVLILVACHNVLKQLLIHLMQMDTINRLLKKQAPKRRGRAAATVLDAVGESGAEEEQEPEKAPALYTRYVQNANGVSLAIPEEWLEAPVGEIFKNPVKNPPVNWSGRMVAEV
jgi:Ino eighty subunit 2